MICLGFESSCDETGVALYCSERGLLAHALYSQIALHAEYGGVVPELASRDHVRKLVPLTKEVFAEADIEWGEVDGIACTTGPGLLGALLVGVAFSRSLALAWDKPFVGVHHMEGHLLAPLMEPEQPSYPFLALLVSGGHTMLVRVEGIGEYSLLSESIDDAVGEAFDKTAKLLGLPYPGGPALAALATEGDPERFYFKRPMTKVDHGEMPVNFSFSGLKTQVLQAVKKLKAANGEVTEQDKADVARAFEDSAVDTLLIKCAHMMEREQVNELVVAGGVGANLQLRARLQTLAEQRGGAVYFPRHELCTDNGAMIAFAGCQRLLAGESEGLTISGRPRWPLTELQAPGVAKACVAGAERV